MLSESPSTFFMHLNKGTKYLSSNGYLPFYYIMILFLYREAPPNLAICIQFEIQPRVKSHGVNYKRLVDAS